MVVAAHFGVGVFESHAMQTARRAAFDITYA